MGLFSLLLSLHLQPPRLSQRLTPTRTWSTEATPTPMVLPMAPTTPTTPSQSSKQLRLRRRRLLCPSTTPSTTATTATHSPTTTERGRPSPLLMPMLMPRRRLLSHSPFPMAGSTTTAMATLAIPLSSLLLARPLSPPSTTMARGLLMPSLLPMLMLRLTLGWHTDTAPTTEDISDMDMEDTELTDIPTTDKDIAARLLFEYLPKCVQRANLEMLNLIYQRVLKPKRSLKIKHLLGVFKKKKKKKKKKS